MKMFWVTVAFWGHLGIAHFASAGSLESNQASIFEADDLILVNTVEATTLFIVLILIGAALELAFQFLKKRPGNFFKTVYGSIVEESMLVGILSMVLIFVSSVGSLSLTWRKMMANAALVLLLMVLFFIAFSMISIFWTLKVIKGARSFERSRMDIDPLLSPSEQILKECRDFFKKSIKLSSCSRCDDVLFSDYLREQSASIIGKFFDLSWKSWGALAVFVVANVIRVRSVVSSEDQRTTYGVASNIATFVAVMGLFPLAMHAFLHFLIRLRVAKMAKKQLRDDHVNIDTKLLLFFSSLGVTTSVFSASVLLFEWYLAFFFLNIVGLAFDTFGPVSVLVAISSLVPPCLSLYLMPWTVIYVTILGTLGKNVDVNVLALLRDAANGEDSSPIAAFAEAKKNTRLLGYEKVQIAKNADPLGSAQRKFAPRSIRPSRASCDNTLDIDDEWATEQPINLRGEESEDERREERGQAPPTPPNDTPQVHTEFPTPPKAETSANPRSWDTLRPMYLPDWRHNPIIAREEPTERNSANELPAIFEL